MKEKVGWLTYLFYFRENSTIHDMKPFRYIAFLQQIK